MGAPVGISVAAASGNVANAAAVATLPAVANKVTQLAGFQLMVGGATAGSIVNATVTGLAAGTLTYPIAVPAGATLDNKLVVTFDPPLPASAANTPIIVTLPAAGAGNTNAAVVANGFQI